MPRHKVARILEDKGIPRVQQQPRAQVDRLLRTMHHQDLLGITGDASGSAQIALQGAPQCRVAFGRHVVQAVLLAQQHSPVRTPPGKARKIPGGDSTV